MVYKELEVKNDEGKVFNVEVYMNGRSIKRIEKEAKEIDPKFNLSSPIICKSSFGDIYTFSI